MSSSPKYMGAMGIRGWLHWWRRRQQTNELKTILSNAKRIAEVNPQALADLIRLLGRQIQSQWMTLPVRSPTPGGFSELNIDSLLFPRNIPLTPQGECFGDLVVLLDESPSVELRKDIVFTAPWHQERVRDALALIGAGKKLGPWKADSNHYLEYWYPLGVSWVTVSGHHSIMAGIVQGEGVVIPRVAYNIQPVYRHVVCDGIFYRRSADRSIISPVIHLEMAAIFEIGRMIIGQ